MKLGFGLYRHMLTPEYFDFAVQCGATHAIVHLCDYGLGSGGERPDSQPVGEEEGWGRATHAGVWTLEEVVGIRDQMAEHGLTLYGVENFDPAQWSDVLLGGPRFEEQMEVLKEQIRIYGEAGIKVAGYNFSLAGVAGRIKTTTRGGAKSVGLRGVNNDIMAAPIEEGMVWNMRVADNPDGKLLRSRTHEELWENLSRFLEVLVPVAEEAGVMLAAHPDDPPLAFVRKQPRLVYRHAMYQKLLDTVPSPANGLEFCVGTLAEMEDEDLLACVEQYASQGKIGYVHLRNVSGKVPYYTETFLDDGDVDVEAVLRILREHHFEGVIIPDHAPSMTCAAPWHAGMAFAMGYLKALMG